MSISRDKLLISVGLLMLVTSLGFWYRNREPLFASPTAPRSDLQKLFGQDWSSYFEEAEDNPIRNSGEESPPLPAVQVLHYPKGDLIQFQRGDGKAPAPAPLEKVVWCNAAGVADLPGGGSLRVLASALSVPQADDPVPPREDQLEPLRFRKLDGAGLSAGEDQELWGVPEALRSVSSGSRWFPMLRLILQVDGEVGPWRAFDRRTEGMVTQAVERHHTSRQGITVLDTGLRIWHDTELVMSLNLACGDEVESPIPMIPGSQAAHGGMQIQFLTILPGGVSRVRRDPDQIYLEKDPAIAGSTIVYRVMPPDRHHHVSLQVEGKGRRERVRLPGGDVGWVSCPLPADDIEGITARFFPQASRVLVRIPELPEMPNPANLPNLFDARIPRFSIPAHPGGESTLDYILLDVISGATQTSVDYWSSSLESEIPEDYLPRHFRETTPRAMLEEYLRFGSDPYVRVDRENWELRFHRPEPWRVRLDRWWYLNAPSWLKP